MPRAVVHLIACRSCEVGLVVGVVAREHRLRVLGLLHALTRTLADAL
jgi:hypothetical protein